MKPDLMKLELVEQMLKQILEKKKQQRPPDDVPRIRLYTYDPR